MTEKAGNKLFKTQKASTELLAAQERQRLSLLKSLSRSIKGVQVMFANQALESPVERGGEACIGDCRAAQRLCAQFEDILRHGLKPGWFGKAPTFWPAVLKISRKQAIQYIKSLQYAQTDNGRCRGWIRLAVNECSLESYINVLCQDLNLLSYYYEVHSFLRNEEMVLALTQLLVGLSQLSFKLTVDTASLEFEAAPEAYNSVQPTLKLKSVEDNHQKHPPGKGKHRSKDHSSGFIPASIENGFEYSPSLSSDETSEGGYGDSVTGEGDSVTGGSGESNNTSPSHTHHTSRERETSPSYSGEVVMENISQGPQTNLEPSVSSDHLEPRVLEPSGPPVLETPDSNNHFEPRVLEPSVSSDHFEPRVLEPSEHLEPSVLEMPVSSEHLESRDSVEHFETERNSTPAPVEHDSSNDEQMYDREDSRERLNMEVNFYDHTSGEVDRDTTGNNKSSTIQQDNHFQDREVEALVSIEDALDDPSPYLGQTDASVEDGEKETLDSVVEPTVLPETGDGNTEFGNEIGSQQVVQHTHIISTNHSKTSYAVNSPSTNVISDTEPVPSLPVDNDSISTKHGDTLKANQLTEPVRMMQGLQDENRSSVVSRDTIVDGGSPLEVSSDKEVRSSRDSTPKRRGTNPFLSSDSEDEEFALRSRGITGTNPFADSDHEDGLSNIPNPSQTHPSQTHPSQTHTSSSTHNRPLSFQIPPPPPRSPSNPFCDDVTDNKTPLCEKQPETSAQVENKYDLYLPLSDSDSLTVSMDTPTISRHLPSLDSLNSSDQPSNPPDQIHVPSSETTPSISPVSFFNEPRDRSSDEVDTESYASSQDLSVILEGAWERVQCPSPLGSPTHLSPTEDHFRAEMSVTDIQAEISRLKVELKEAIECGEESGKGGVRRRIVMLQMRMQQSRDAEEETLGDSSYQEVFGHKFVRQPRQTKLHVTPPTCEGCGKRVRGLIRPWYMCNSCNTASHKGCISKITRRCTSGQLIKLQEDPTYIFAVCPEKGLTQQKFRCGSCTQLFNGPSAGAKLCDYTGLYHCRLCHHGDVSIIPARVLHNWDFKTKKVCCRCSDLLGHHFTKPLVHVKKINPHLYTHVQDLNTVEDLRKDLLIMKKYFIQCRAAREVQLLQRLNNFLHFKNSAKKYSLSDLVDIQDGSLLPRLQEAHGEFATHIKQDCTVCSGKGFVCEMCNSGEILFPFDRLTRQCDACSAVFHKICFSEMTTCPKCVRFKERNK